MKKLWHRLFPPKLVEPPDAPNADFKLGYHSGYWSGVLQGRKDALHDLEEDMASQGKTIGEIEPDDVVRARLRIIH